MKENEKKNRNETYFYTFIIDNQAEKIYSYYRYIKSSDHWCKTEERRFTSVSCFLG